MSLLEPRFVFLKSGITGLLCSLAPEVGDVRPFQNMGGDAMKTHTHRHTHFGTEFIQIYGYQGIVHKLT